MSQEANRVLVRINFYTGRINLKWNTQGKKIWVLGYFLPLFVVPLYRFNLRFKLMHMKLSSPKAWVEYEGIETIETKRREESLEAPSDYSPPLRFDSERVYEK
jgi:hypothetical protein